MMPRNQHGRAIRDRPIPMAELDEPVYRETRSLFTKPQFFSEQT